MKKERELLKEDIIEYLELSEEDAKKIGTGHYVIQEQEFDKYNAMTAEELWTHYQHRDKSLLSNAEFAMCRKPMYDSMVMKWKEGRQSVFVHGAGCGFNAIILAKLGMDVCFYEPNIKEQNFIRWRAEKYDIMWDVKNATNWSPKNLYRYEFDLIVSYDVLEHLVAPFRTICNLGNMLSDNGVLLMMPAFTFEHHQHLLKHRTTKDWLIKKVMDLMGFNLLEYVDGFYVYDALFSSSGHDAWKI